MTANLRHAIRTVVQVGVGIAAAVPSIVVHLPTSAVLVQVAAVAGVVTHYFPLVEKIPGFPAWLLVD